MTNFKVKQIKYSFTKSILTAFSVMSVMGCMVGPDFENPASPETDDYIAPQKDPVKTVKSKGRTGKSQKFVRCEELPAEWWRLFRSPELNHLIVLGLNNSPNLNAAEATLCQASQNLQAGIGLLLPTFTANGGGVRQRVNGASFDDISNQIKPTTLNLFNASVNVNYPLDFWGSARRQIESLAALEDYQRFIYEATYLTIAGNIATTAITEASLRAQIKATQELIELNQQQLDIFNKQFELGGISRIDILTQETLIATLEASLPPLQKSLSQTRHALSMLIGELPSEDCLPSFSLNSLHLPEDLPISVPSRLVD